MAAQKALQPLLESRSVRAQNAVILLSAPFFALSIVLGLFGLVSGLYSSWHAWKGILIIGSVAVGTTVYQRWKMARMETGGRAVRARIGRRVKAPVDWDKVLARFGEGAKSVLTLLPVEMITYTFDDTGGPKRGVVILLTGEQADTDEEDALTVFVDPEYSYVRSVLIQPP